MKNRKIELTFWGTRGSIPSPGKGKSKYGGNTSCIELSLPNHELIILDGGTGIRELGNSLMLRKKKVCAYIFLTHYHWDHIQGLPYFAPAYNAGYSLTILGADHPEFPLEKILSSQMESIHFPVKSSSLSANISLKKLSLGNYSIAETEVKAIRTNHPGINFSYSFTFDDRKFIYMTDNELLPRIAKAESHIAYERESFIRFIHEADMLIHDAQYSDKDYLEKKGWGHSTWREVAKLAVEGEVKHLILFHHDPNHSDSIIDSFVKECKEELKKMKTSIKCSGAMEGKTIPI
jgi:phosphoribosyl 1,2-cyclic phosphodiesterase